MGGSGQVTISAHASAKWLVYTRFGRFGKPHIRNTAALTTPAVADS